MQRRHLIGESRQAVNVYRSSSPRREGEDRPVMKEEDVSHRRVRGIKTGSMDVRIEELERIGGGEVCWVRHSSLLILSRVRRLSTCAAPPPSIHHAVMDYSNAAAIITNTLAPPAYMPFRLEAAPMKFAGIVFEAVAEVATTVPPVAPAAVVVLLCA